MKIKLQLIAAILSGFSVTAQYNFSALNNPHLSNIGHYLLPSTVGDNITGGELHLINFYGGVANNFLRLGDINSLSGKSNLQAETIDNILAAAPEKNKLWAGVDMPILNGFFNIRRGRKPFLSFGLGARQKLDANMKIDKNTLSLLYKGNKQFAGNTVSLTPEINALSHSELFLTAACSFDVMQLDSANRLRIKPAIRLRYLRGLAALQMPHSSIDMFTSSDGKYIDFNSALTVQMASVIDTPSLSSLSSDLDPMQAGSTLKASGKGWGWDLGASASFRRNLQAHIALIDMGGITFSKNTVTYNKNSSYRYEGYVWEPGSKDSNVTVGNLKEVIQPEESHETFTMPLGAKIVLGATYQMRLKKPRDRRSFYKHTVAATYVQGSRNFLNGTTTPMLNVGYTYSVFNQINMGSSVTLGGLNGAMVGAHMSFFFEVLKFGVASQNILPYLGSKSARGSDFHAFVAIVF